MSSSTFALANRAQRLLRSNPRLFWAKARQRITTPAMRDAPAHGVSRTLQDAVARLEGAGATKVAAYGDRRFFDELTEAAPGIDVRWASHRLADVEGGATLAAHALREPTHAVVVGGPDVRVAYPAVLRLLADADRLPEIVWVADGWERCGSQLHVPRDADDVDLYLYDHFAEYFLVKDPLLVEVVARDEVAAARSTAILRPGHTMHLRLSDLLPERQGPAAIEIETTHPVLTRGRHERWRLCADVHRGSSFTTLHGAHDFGPAHPIESRRPGHDLTVAAVTVVLPADPTRPGSPDVTVAGGDGERTQARSGSVVDEVRFDVDPSAATGVYGYRLTGPGTPFWYACATDRRGEAVLAGNHELSVRIRDDARGLAGDVRRAVEGLADAGFLLHPHALPLGADPEIELGCSFRAANPTVAEMTGWLFDDDGELVRDVRFSLPATTPLFGDELASILGAAGGLVVFGPDCTAAGVDPAEINFSGDLIARRRSTGDFDITEFQSCWRNLGAEVPGFPHWIAPANAVLGRTNVLARLRHGSGYRTGLIVANASGRRDHAGVARLTVRVTGADGAAAEATTTLRAFTATTLWIDELFDGLEALVPSGFGAVQLISLDADLNGQLVTTSDAGAVSLQHLWGY
ncbi:MAG TPA: hypothetical protein VM142_07970 [Acidimicrobiales bacterium]|nr:hypothetical protein [Acidimicrobiales bacterium]